MMVSSFSLAATTSDPATIIQATCLIHSSTSTTRIPSVLGTKNK